MLAEASLCLTTREDAWGRGDYHGAVALWMTWSSTSPFHQGEVAFVAGVRRALVRRFEDLSDRQAVHGEAPVAAVNAVD